MNLRQVNKPFGCLLIVGGFGCLAILLSFLVLFGIVLLNPGYLVSLSHVEANVPPQKEFDEILARDLQAYFQDLKGKQVGVQYEFLRRGPTQVGVAYPKFYLWVKIYEGDRGRGCSDCGC